MYRSTNSKREPNIHIVRQSMRTTYNHIPHFPKCPYPKKKNVKRFNDITKCNDSTKITRISCVRCCYEAWHFEACNNNHVCTDSKNEKRHKQRHHNVPNNKLKIPHNEATSIDVEAEFQPMCFKKPPRLNELIEFC